MSTSPDDGYKSSSGNVVFSGVFRMPEDGQSPKKHSNSSSLIVLLWNNALEKRKRGEKHLLPNLRL
jgi:hypothetical protein